MVSIRSLRCIWAFPGVTLDLLNILTIICYYIINIILYHLTLSYSYILEVKHVDRFDVTRWTNLKYQYFKVCSRRYVLVFLNLANISFLQLLGSRYETDNKRADMFTPDRLTSMTAKWPRNLREECFYYTSNARSKQCKLLEIYLPSRTDLSVMSWPLICSAKFKYFQAHFTLKSVHLNIFCFSGFCDIRPAHPRAGALFSPLLFTERSTHCNSC